MVVIREVCQSDAVALARLVTSLDYPVEAEELWQRIKKMPQESYATLVAQSGDQIAGFIGLLTLPVYEHPQPIGWILALSVAPEHRSQGIGRMLIEAAEDYYRKRGVTDLRVHSGAHRSGAHKFYEKAGYQKSGFRFKKAL